MPPRRRTKGGAAKATIEGPPGSNFLVVTLAPGQKLQTSPGSLIYMKGDVIKGEVSLGGIGKAFARAFGGENFVLTTYEGGPKGGEIGLGLDIPGDIVRIDLQPNQEYIISRGSYMCSTDNIEVSSTTRVRGIISVGQDEGLILPVVRTKETAGVVWLCSYGTFKRIDLNKEPIILDNGTFLACDSSIKYTLAMLGKGATGFLFGGESVGMKFEGVVGPLWIQSKNFSNFKLMMSGQEAPSLMNAAEQAVGENIGNAMFDKVVGMFGSKGGKGRPKKMTKARV